MALLSFKFPTSSNPKKSVPLETDVIDTPGSAYGALNSKLALPGEQLGAAWFLPNKIKWQMLQDSQVYAAVMIWKMGVLIDGYKISPAVDPGHKRYKRAKEISDFCNYCADNIQGSFHMKMLQLLDSCIWGHKAISQVYREQKFGEYKGKFVVDYLRVVPDSFYRIRTDDFGRPIGLQGVSEKENEGVIGMNKFLFCSFRPHDDHPHGTNLLWPIYDAWWQKKQIVPERLDHAKMFGSPSWWVEAPDGARETDLLDKDNNPVKDPATGMPVKVPINRALLEVLLNFRGNGSGTVMPNGAKLNMAQAAGKGEVFQSYQGDLNAEIIKGVLWTTLMTETGANQSRASSQTGEGTVQLTIADGKFMLQDLIKEQFCGNLVQLNWKEKDWDLVPRVTFGDNQRNITSLFNAISALWSVGFFDDTQRSALCHLLGLPDPDPDAARPVGGQAGGALKYEQPKNTGNNADPNAPPPPDPEKETGNNGDGK